MIRIEMIETEKKKLTLSVDSEIVEKAKELDINISDVTEKILRALTSSSKTANKEKLYTGYQQLFNLMLPLLRKFQVSTIVGVDVIYDQNKEPDFDPDGNPIPPEPLDVFRIQLGYDGRLVHDGMGDVKITDMTITDFFPPKMIIDDFLDAIQKGVNYKKDQFKEIEMAKTIIDVITKGTIPKSKKSKGKKK